MVRILCPDNRIGGIGRQGACSVNDKSIEIQGWQFPLDIPIERAALFLSDIPYPVLSEQIHWIYGRSYACKFLQTIIV